MLRGDKLIPYKSEDELQEEICDLKKELKICHDKIKELRGDLQILNRDYNKLVSQKDEMGYGLD